MRRFLPLSMVPDRPRNQCVVVKTQSSFFAPDTFSHLVHATGSAVNLETEPAPKRCITYGLIYTVI